MNVWLMLAAISGFLAVAAGAFGAHMLQDRLDAHSMMIYESAARYHMVHALAMGLAAFAIRGAAAKPAQWSAAALLAGSVLFSGSLYIFAFTGLHALAFVTPFGGLAFLIGWAMLAFAATRLER